MTDWPVKTLGEVALVGAGNSAPQDKELFKGGIYRFVRTSDVGQVRIGRLGESADLLNDAGAEGLREFRAGVTLIPKSGASTFLNHRVQLTKPCFVSSHLAVVDSNPEVMDDTFMFYFLQTVRSQDLIQDQSYPSLNLPAISGINVLVPPLEEQKRIVALLDAATARVTELTACYEQARTHANNLYESACRTEFDNQHSKSPLVTLPDVCENLDGRRKPITKSDREAGDIPYYGASGIVDYVKGYIFDERTLLISEDGANLLARSTPIAFTADGKYWVNNHAHVVKFENTVTETYVEIFLNSIPIDNWVTGAAQPKLTQAALNRIPIPMPSLDDQKRIVGRLDSMRAKTSEMVAAYDAKLTAAKNLRQSILEAAFAGDL